MGTYTNDVLGNRTQLTAPISSNNEYFTWDDLNRMPSWHRSAVLSTSDIVSYQYRADGQRVEKNDQWTDPNNPYYYGQMGIQDIVVSGAEGKAFPIYDTHGNMVATLARSGINSYSTADWQSYDVWGGVRSGSSTQDQGYVANLGHRRDAESGLTYMRARYYEPATGRFVSKDRSSDGGWPGLTRNADRE